MGLAGCGTDPVWVSDLPADPARVPGPTFVQLPVGDRAQRVAPRLVTPEGNVRVKDGWSRGLQNDGDLVVAGHGRLVLHRADGTRDSVAADIDPIALGITPEAVSVPSADGLGVFVFSPDLTEHREVRVADPTELSDQGDGEDAVVALTGTPLTLAGVTWVEWSVNSEDDELTDHGVVRMEGDRAVGVLADEPVVRLLAAHDGSALFVLRQDNGKEDCGGCVVAQNLAEIDTRTGEIGAEYGMPPGYDKTWRVDAVDKVDGTVAVRFRTGTGGVLGWHLWTYDGEWREVRSYEGARVWFQDGGRLVETATDPGSASDTSTGQYPAEIRWVPGESGPLDMGSLLFEPNVRWCSLDSAEKSCPLLVTAGALLPRPVR